jgi:hypothetical protein
MKKIQFIPISEAVPHIINPPIPASRKLPEWYKHQNPLIGDKITLNEQGNVNSTVKKCMPVLDDMTTGYYITLPSDLMVSWNDGVPAFSWSLDTVGSNNIRGEQDFLPNLINSHSTEQVSHLPIPPEYCIHPQKFSNYWRILTPKGYSCMFRHPSWWFDLPFYTLSGVVDTDKHPIPINFPFLIRNGWEGVIEEGTPIAQVIPFKRTVWQSEVVMGDNEEGFREYRKSTKKLMHRYKDNWREVKTWK